MDALSTYILMITRGMYLYIVLDRALAFYQEYHNKSRWCKGLYTMTALMMLTLALQLIIAFSISCQNEVPDMIRRCYNLTDILIMPFITSIVYILLRHKLPNKKKLCWYFTPFVLMPGLYILTGNSIVESISYIYLYGYGIYMTWKMYNFFNAYQRKLYETYSDIDGFELGWLKNTIYCFLLIAVLWSTIIIYDNQLTTAAYNIIAMCIWYYLCYRILHIKEAKEIGDFENNNGNAVNNTLSHDIETKINEAKDNGVFAKPDLNIIELASIIGFRKEDVSAYFESKATTFFAYVNKTRLEMAVKRIEDSQYESMMDIAKHVGFSNLKSFELAFELKYGCTPDIYKEKLNIASIKK